MALTRGHLWLLRKRLIQQALRKETASGSINVRTTMIKMVSRLQLRPSLQSCDLAWTCAMHSKEILLATRQVSTAIRRKTPKIHFTTEYQTDGLGSSIFSRWTFAISLTVYFILSRGSELCDRCEELIASLLQPNPPHRKDKKHQLPKTKGW